MRFPLIALPLGLLALTLPVSSARAQGHGGFGPGLSGRAGSAFTHRGAAGPRSATARRSHRFYSGPNYYPYYDPYFDSYYDSADAPDELPPPPSWQPAPPSAQATPSKPVESVVMELRGDRWVRLTNYGVNDTGDQPSEPRSAARPAGTPSKSPAAFAQSQAPPITELPPAVLVFRDGHQEQISKYTIVGATIYVKGDYWTNGMWTRRIPVPELNLAATMQQNQQRGVKFSLPSRPSEVIVR
jgi:hypothetical protein